MSKHSINNIMIIYTYCWLTILLILGKNNTTHCNCER